MTGALATRNFVARGLSARRADDRLPPAPPPPSPVTSGGTTSFFAIALGFTLLLQLPAVLAQRGFIAGPLDEHMPLAALGAFGPLIAALVASRLERGGPGVRGRPPEQPVARAPRERATVRRVHRGDRLSGNRARARRPEGVARSVIERAPRVESW